MRLGPRGVVPLLVFDPSGKLSAADKPVSTQPGRLERTLFGDILDVGVRFDSVCAI